MELEQGKNVDFWRDMTTITEDEISKLRKLEASGKGPGTVTHTFIRLLVSPLNFGHIGKPYKDCLCIRCELNLVESKNTA